MKPARTIVALLMTVVLLMSVIGVAAAEETERTGEGITIRLLTRMSGTDSSVVMLEELKAAFLEKYPDITFQDESVSDSNAFNNQFKTDIASGNVADIIQWPGICIMKEYAENNVFLDLSDLIAETEDVRDNIDPSLISMMDLTSVGVPGIYALPYSNQMEVFYYRKDLFEAAGIEKTPETWAEFGEACEKLLAIGVIPWSVGGTNAWRFIHIQTGLMYRNGGVQLAIDLGAGILDWTDSRVVENIQYMQDLAAKGYMGTDYMGIDYETEKARLISGETAMSFDGTWRIASFVDEGEEFLSNIGTFRMPYFEDQEEYYYNDISYPAQLELGGQLKDDPEKLAYVWEFAAMFVSKANQEFQLYNASLIPVRTDIEVDVSKLNPVLEQVLSFQPDVSVWGSDNWAYDTEASLEIIVGDAYVGAMSGMTAEAAAQQIQDNLDEASDN